MMTIVPAYPQETPDLDSSTEAYARRFEGPVGNYFLEVQSTSVLGLLPAPAHDFRVLDVGGGHGQLVVPLVRSGYDVTVVGSNDSCCRRLDQIAGSNRYQFRSGSLLDLPCESNSFDVVLAFRLLPHLENWNRFLSELCRVAKQCLIVDYPESHSGNLLSSITFAIKRTVETNTRRYRCFRRSEIVKELRLHGFQPQFVQGQFFFPMAFHRLMRLAFASRSMEALARRCGLTRLFGSPVILKASPIPSPSL